MEGATTELEKTSAARRLRVFFERCPSFSNNVTVGDAWVNALGITAEKDNRGAAIAELARQLSLILLQLNVLEARLRIERPMMSAETTSHQIDRFRIFIGSCLGNLQNPWSNLKNQLSPDLMKCLAFWDELIEKDEIVLPNSELNGLLVSLRELRGHVEGINTNPELKAVLLKIIEVLIQGITDYHLEGEDAIRSAARDAFSYIFRNEDLIRRNSDAPAVRAMGAQLDKFVRVCEKIVLADGLIHAAGTAKALVNGFLKMVGHNPIP